jgi:DNA gyrase/topoisomerase IV subunit B
MLSAHTQPGALLLSQVQGGHATRIEIDLDLTSGWVTVTDDGRGIPTDIHPATGKSTLETVSLKEQKHCQYRVQQHSTGVEMQRKPQVTSALAARMESTCNRSRLPDKM